MNLILPHLTIVICSNLSSRTGGNSRGAFVGVSKFTRASGDETPPQIDPTCGNKLSRPGERTT
jgi:hypothetical protein